LLEIFITPFTIPNPVVPNPHHKLLEIFITLITLCILVALNLVINCVKLVSVSITIISLNIKNNYQHQYITRIRDNNVREGNEYFQQFMMRVRDNRVRNGKGGNEYF